MNLEEIQNALKEAMVAQEQAEIDALNTQQLLGQQQIMYNNDARGTLYSGQPTWERAQLAAEGASNLADVRSNYLDRRIETWNTITDYLDKINSYNEAAAALTSTASSSGSSNQATQSFLDFYNSLGSEQ